MSLQHPGPEASDRTKRLTQNEHITAILDATVHEQVNGEQGEQNCNRGTHWSTHFL